MVTGPPQVPLIGGSERNRFPLALEGPRPGPQASQPKPLRLPCLGRACVFGRDGKLWPKKCPCNMSPSPFLLDMKTSTTHYIRLFPSACTIDTNSFSLVVCSSRNLMFSLSLLLEKLSVTQYHHNFFFLLFLLLYQSTSFSVSSSLAYISQFPLSSASRPPLLTHPTPHHPLHSLPLITSPPPNTSTSPYFPLKHIHTSGRPGRLE